MKITWRSILIFASVVLLIFGLWYFRNIVVYVLISGVLSLIGRPLVDLFHHIKVWKLSMPKWLSALLTVIVIWGTIFFSLSIFIPLVSSQVEQFSSIDSDKIMQLVESPVEKVEGLIGFFDSDLANEVPVEEYIRMKISKVLSATFIQDFLQSVLGVFGNLAVALFSITFITFFFLKDERLFYDSIMMWIPDQYSEGDRKSVV